MAINNTSNITCNTTTILNNFLKRLHDLQVNQIIKNYKELCSLLSLPVLTSDSKKAQLKELERFIRFDKDGHKFIIKEIYSNPLEKNDKRFSQLTKDLKTILGFYILHPEYYNSYSIYKKKTEYTLSRVSLWRMFGFINSNYKTINNTDIIQSNMKLDVDNISLKFHNWILNKFYSTIGSKCTQLLSRVLSSMVNDNILNSWKIKYRICDDHGVYRNVTTEEEGEIKLIEDKLLREKYKCNSKSVLAITSRINIFYKDLSDYLFNIYGWTNVTTVICIDVKNMDIIKYQYGCFTAKDVISIKINVNKKVINDLTESEKKKYEKAMDDYYRYENNLADNFDAWLCNLNNDDNMHDTDHDKFNADILGDAPVKYPSQYLCMFNNMIDMLVKYER